MSVNFEVGPATLALIDPDPDLRGTVLRLLDPYEPVGGSTRVPDLCLSRSRARPAAAALQGDAGDGLVSGMGGADLPVYIGRDWFTLGLRPEQATLTLSERLPMWRVFGPVVRPVLQLGLHRHGALAVHASSARLGGTGVLVAGWSESGKTETILALLEAGARFVSDKWTIVGREGSMSAFPVPIFVRRWVLQYLPRLAASVGPRARALLLAGRAADALSEPARRIGAKGPGLAMASSTFLRAAALADGIRLRPAQLRTLYADSAPPVVSTQLDAIAVLTTIPGGAPSVRDVEPRLAARRLARSAAFERRGYYELAWRMTEAPPGGSLPVADNDARVEEALLHDWLTRLPAIEVRAPFPTDPRRVADLIVSTLRP
jgi:hypothetical protein